MTAHCQKAIFFRAHCEDTDFSIAHCENADFRQAWFSSATVFFDCTINDATDFTSTALGSIRVEPGKRERMEYNVRRLTWEQRYRDQTRFMKQGLQLKGLQKLRSLFSRLLAWLYLSPVKFFWHVSDYGYSTGRVIAWFAFFILVFTSLYTFFPWMLMINNAVVEAPLFERALQMLAFATSTMVTLGFSNINVAIENGRPVLIGMFVVSCNLIVGYFMLAVLVTRLGILFQSLGPAEPRDKIRSEVEEKK